MTHPLPERFRVELRLDAGRRVILILDPAAASRRADIIRLAVALTADLAQGAITGLALLGNPSPLPATDLPRQAAGWLSANSARPRLLAPAIYPLLAELPPNDLTPILILADGPIHDLDDFRGLPLWSRLRSVYWDQPQTAATDLPGLQAPQPDRLRHWLHDPPTHLRLHGPGFLPLDWSQPELVENFSYGAFSLAGSPTPTEPLQLRCLLCPDAPLHLTIQTRAGHTEHRQLTPLPDTDPGPTGALSPREVAALDAARAHQDIDCPRCGARHPWHQLRCKPPRALLPRPIYDSLPAAGGLFILHRHADGASYTQAGKALALPHGLAALREPGDPPRVQLLQFHRPTGRWHKRKHPFPPYQPLGRDRYGLCL